MILGKLLDDSTEDKIEVFKMDMKKLFDYTDEEEEVSLYIKAKDEVYANGVHCRPTLFVLEKLLQDLGFTLMISGLLIHQKYWMYSSITILQKTWRSL